MTALIEASELAAIIKQDNVKILDASFPVPAPSAPRLEKAVPFDIDDIADQTAPLPHMLPTEAVFQDKVQALGINKDDMIIVYDQKGLAFAAARVWWMFRVFGHENIRILNGGLPIWISEGGETAAAPPDPVAKGNFKARFNPQLVKSVETIRDNIVAQGFQTLDVRDQPRYLSAHIPGSSNLPFMSLINPDTGQLKQVSDTKPLFQQAEIDLKQPIVTSCGSGVTACVAALALYELGIKDAAVYDGSWTEWSQRADLPVNTASF